MAGLSDIENWTENAPKTVDLTQPELDAWVRRAAQEMHERFPTEEGLQRLEESALGAPVPVRLAMKLAQSRQRVVALADDFRLSVVFAVYKEHNRLRTRVEHPHGEDLIVRKVAQLDWLFAGLRRASWKMLIVDDGCPERSGAIARKIIESHGLADRVKVLFLQDAIDAAHPGAAGITSTADSQKGGSVEYGMAVAAEQTPAHAEDAISETEGTPPRHVVVFTDADLSTHLGQVGLLVDPILRGGQDAAIGSRREPTSVVIKSGARNTRGKLFIYLWKRLIPELSPIIDTQCGFKAFRADIARTIVADTIEKRFAFDIELLLQTVLKRRNSIAIAPIAWIDSEAASTTKELQPYLPMLHSIVRIARRYVPLNEQAQRFAALIDSLDEASWLRLSENVPEDIANREPIEFETYDGVTARDLREIALVSLGLSR